MSWNPNDNETDESEDEYEYHGGGRDAFIFLIDAFLFETLDKFEECLDLIKNSIMNGILTRNNDLIGIVFYNTTNSPNPKDNDGMKNIVVHKNTAVFMPLSQLSKPIVDYYLEFIAPDYFDFGNRYGCTECTFTDAIWLCTNMFMQCGVKLAERNIILFTEKDTPHDLNSRKYQLAMEKADDLKQNEFHFNVIPMKHDFNYDQFYKEFICTVEDIDIDTFINPDIEKEKKLISDRLVRQNYQKRCNNHLRWKLGDGLEISVGMYNYFCRDVYPKSVKLLRKDNSIVEVKHVHKVGVVDSETNEITEERYCMPSDQRKVITIGGEKISFTSEEIAKIRSPLPPGLTLLGFKPSSAISLHNFVRSSSFLYPDETIIAGSTQLFRVLWEQCIEKDKIAFCTLVARRKVSPRFVALFPTQSLPENNFMDKDGFRVVYLPCEVDYRNIDLSEYETSDIIEPEINIFEKIVKKLRVNYTPEMFKDPNIERLYANIMRLAFDMPTENTGNGGLPDIETQDERIQPFIDELVNLFGTDLEVAPKRKAGANEDQRGAKSQKITDELLTKDQMDQLITTNSLEQLTVKQLKTYLQQNDVKGISSATKPTLIQKVIELHS